jgi:hypothetical protein
VIAKRASCSGGQAKRARRSHSTSTFHLSKISTEKKASVRGLFLKFSRLRMANSGNRICRSLSFAENRQEVGKCNKPAMRVFTDFK